MQNRGWQRKAVALLVLGVLATLAWSTMDSGKIRLLVFVLLGGFALRILLTAGRQSDEESPQ
ncbi:hypothetical protein [Alloacidobacterium sp.]|uniref:hypothetical protein n=1 Tax=Alloacidobacterium sp. TaxID=2951999 RepID=UPI002D314A6B|nr:hypothetical protein [Alloacidobacterium sp.]HYK36985.1 hypothetical protein [Alloacidobacterium sp.]